MSGSVQAIRLVPGEVDLATLRRIYQEKVTLQLAEEARADIDRARETVEAIVASGKVVYGINTGFGKLAQTQIPAERLAELQRNLVLSHSVASAICCRTTSPAWWSPAKSSAWLAATRASAWN